MACPTCSCTMQGLDGMYFWCPRCGTLGLPGGDLGTLYDEPKLVERCRKFEDSVAGLQTVLWDGLGIAEAIRPPEMRRSAN